MKEETVEAVVRAKRASIPLSALDTETKDRALELMGRELDSRREEILAANREDVEYAEEMVSMGKMSNSLLQRLKLSDEKISDMIRGIEDVARLGDPVGRTLSAIELDESLNLYQVSCPIGLIGVIFESRPDVIPQIMSLCLKSGNATVFKGGSEARISNRTIFDILKKALSGISGFPLDAFHLLETREDIEAILGMDQQIDLLIPRGSNRLVRYIQESTRIPVLGHASGICHAYVDAVADLDTALRVVLDSKVQYAAACNAIETLLVHEGIAARFLPEMAKGFIDSGVEMRCDPLSHRIVAGEVGEAGVRRAEEDDWSTEYNDLVISIRVVGSLGDAIGHINTYGSHHTDAIITASRESAERFCSLVDSSSVMVNASTRFADGYRYGKGAELGISTSKIHSRGPVGMEGLMTYKYVLVGKGQVVSEYSEDGGRGFTHRELQEGYRIDL